MVEKWKQLSRLLNPNRIGVGDVMFLMMTRTLRRSSFLYFHASFKKKKLDLWKILNVLNFGYKT